MSLSNRFKKTEILLSDRLGIKELEGRYEIAFRRWLVGELDSGRLTEGQAIERFGLHPGTAPHLFRKWRKRYRPDIPLTLPAMSESEKQELEALHRRIRELEQHLDDARLKHAALETLIDVAEEQLQLDIRKKSGPKQ